MVDELEEVQINIIIRKEERKFLLRKLCEYEPQIALEVQNTAKDGPLSRTSGVESKKTKKKPHLESIGKLSTFIFFFKGPFNVMVLCISSSTSISYFWLLI